MAAAVLVTLTAQGHCVSVSTDVVVVAQIQGVSLIGCKVKTDDTSLEISSMTWSEQIVGAGWQKASARIELSVSCNYRAWSVDIHTNNVSAHPDLLQKGGLLSLTNNALHIPLAWVVSDSTVPITAVGEPGELLTNTVTGKGNTAQAAWRYLKDINDMDNLNTTAWNESWSVAQAGGYTSVVSGTCATMRLPYGITANSPLIIYIEGDFNSIEGGAGYQSTIWFDLVFQ